jgi:energy-coupling factor transport system ATP-binding protein
MSVAVADPALCARDLVVTYRDAATPAVRGISLAVRAGEIVVIMGATGSGRSTLVKSLARIVPSFHPATVAGEITVCGESVGTRSVRDLAGTVGVVFQDFEAQLFSTNVQSEVAFAMEHLAVPAAEMPARAEAALAAVGLVGFGGRDPATLSGGEKQRLAIAGLLALDPAILLLDEPTTDLDPLGRVQILDLLRRLRAQGRAIVVVEHEIAAAVTADRIILLREGAIVADGRPGDILPQIAQFEACGVRPHDVARVLDAFAVPPLGLWIDNWSDDRGDERHRIDAMYVAAYDRLTAAGVSRRVENGGGAAAAALSRPSALRLAVERLSFQYRAGVPVLDDVSVAIGAGEFVALMGHNGSGKTTLAKHLAGLLDATSGSVRLGGVDVRRLRPPQLAAEIGFVFQDPDHQLFAATAVDEVAFGPRNLGLAPDEVAARAGAALDAVGLAHRADADPFLLDKGERQRLAVASVLSMQPTVLILDEPTTGLDYREQRTMMGLLTRLNRGGTTVVIITHTPWVVAEYAERAIMMGGGRVLWDGAVRKLFADPALLARAAFHPPDVTALGYRFGVVALRVDELIDALERPRC